MNKNWWKEQVIYQIYPRSFKDSNGDGIGDLRGILEKLDYLKKLGVDILWLSPIYQSPNDDNGYDISDYYNIMDEFGTMADFDELLAGVHARGMKLLMDLVVNHTSDEHQWFEESRKSKDNPYRDYYHWLPAENGKPPTNWRSFFAGSTWEYDEKTEEYYLHLFTKKQPDLNWENPKVREEIYKLMRFWLDKGVDGFRMDVISVISKRFPLADAKSEDFNVIINDVYANGPRMHEFLQEMHREVMSKYDVMTVGEGPGIDEQVVLDYVGKDRKELNMVFHFGHMFMDHGPGGRFDVVDKNFIDFKKVFTNWDKAVGEEGWINIFLDNHDFPRIVSRWGNDGIYREASAKLFAMLLLSMRGTPCLYQGTEIGMTNVAFDTIEDYRDVEIHNFYKQAKADGADMDAFLKAVHINGRDNVRTPMHWNNTSEAGFTDGEPWIKVNPNYPEINVAAALDDPNSVFYFYQKMLKFRKANPTLIYGSYQDLMPEHELLFCYARQDAEHTFYIIFNFSEKEVQFEWTESVEQLIGNYQTVKGKENWLRPWEGRIVRRLD